MRKGFLIAAVKFFRHNLMTFAVIAAMCASLVSVSGCRSKKDDRPPKKEAHKNEKSKRK